MPIKGRWKAADRIDEFNHIVSKHYEASPTPTMRSQSFAALTAAALLQAVDARIQVHSFLQTQPLLNDVYQVEMTITDDAGNSRLVCHGGSTGIFSSPDTSVCLDYDNGGCIDPEWSVCSSDNTRQVIVYNNGYPEYVDPVATNYDTTDCAPCTESGCLQCSLWESCFSDTSDCPTCDFRANFVCLEGDRSRWN